MNISNTAIDSITIGIPMRSNIFQDILVKLTGIIPPTSTPIAIKYSENGARIIDNQNEHLELAYNNKVCRRGYSISKQLHYFSAVFLIENNGKIVGVAKKHLRADYISVEIFGLSQYHNDKKMAEKIAFCDFLIDNMKEPYKVLGLDVAVDFEVDFDIIKRHFKKVFVANYNDRHKLKIQFTPYDKTTAYFQPAKSGSRAQYCLYNKTIKNDLRFLLSRFEATYKTDCIINSKDEFIDICSLYIEKTKKLLRDYT